MTSKEIRQQFFDFFKGKEHKIVPSSPVVPFDDPTLLFANAGMNQFKDVFLGKGTREYTRAADTQKCIRVSGKHNDLEEVGHDTYHHTFFEMLGNWSFGDYYKEEAIKWAWELLTEVWKLPKERLYATIFREDQEAFELWKTKTDINPEHILYFDEKDNFWEMGDTGPCGPCSEIHINMSNDPDDASLVNADSPECIEIWNLVFIQNFRDEEGKLHDLPQKHIDTGMGFERVCAVLQGKKSNYDTDVFTPLLKEISKIAGIDYTPDEKGTPMRVIADHIRALTFSIADGAVPGSEGRGYVLRRILRRAARYGRKLNLNDPFMYKLVGTVVKQMGEVFPEIIDKQNNIEKIIKGEEESFNATLDRGIELFEQISAKMKKDDTVSGDDVFKLYDTFGFPADLTAVMAREKGLKIDLKRFDELMQEQKKRARADAKSKTGGFGKDEEINLIDFDLTDDKPTEFLGYDVLSADANVIGIKNDGKISYIILDKTPFYAESGGQIDDYGFINFAKEKLPVSGLKKTDGKVIHIVENKDSLKIKPGDPVIANVDSKRRRSIMRNHSATHFLHAALREVLGTHVKQAGSYVGPDRLRFDFTHFEKVKPEELQKIEDLVNEKLFENIELQHHRSIPFDEAKEMGAMMFFGDKYGEFVNVVQFSDFSLEFCGGTHVKNSAQIGLFKIISEASAASGIRRIEAVTGEGARNYLYEVLNKVEEEKQKLAQIHEEKKKLEKELDAYQLREKMGGLDDILSNPTDVEGIKVYKGIVDAGDMDSLKTMGDELRNKMKDSVGILFTEMDGKAGIVCVVNDSLIKDKKLMAGKIVGDIAKLLGGGGGGKPHLATAGAKDVDKIDDALKQVEKIIRKYV